MILKTPSVIQFKTQKSTSHKFHLNKYTKKMMYICRCLKISLKNSIVNEKHGSQIS